jgi:uncharacterized membrane protein YfcA
LAAITVGVAGTVRGFSGFGAGLMMMGPLALLFGLPTAVVSVAVIDAGAAPAMLWGVWKLADRKRALLAAGAAALTLPLGTYILQTQDPTLLRQGAGVSILVFVVLISLGFKWRGGGMPATAVVGAAGGLIGGATSLIGPPVILYFLARNDPADRTRATLAIYISAVVFSQAIILAIAEAKSSVAGWDAWMNAAFLIPIYAGGIFLGRRLFGYASPLFYRRIALTLVTAAGVLAVAG